MNADDLACVDIRSRFDEHAPPFLEIEQGVSHGFARRFGYQHAVIPPRYVARLIVPIVAEYVIHQPGSGADGAELILETDQAPRRNLIFEAHAALRVRLHALQFSPALPQLLHDRTLVFGLDVNYQLLVRLQLSPGLLAHDDFRSRYGEFVALPPHGFDQDGEVQFATSRNLELLGVIRFLDTQRDVVQRLAQKPLAHLPAGQVLAFPPGER